MVKIDENYFIDADTICYTLLEYSGKDKEGNDKYRTLGYYRTIEDCVKGVLKDKTRNYISKNNVGLKELSNEIKKQTEYIKSLKLEV